jgi:DNA-binding transcriptional ArsR family regulator
MGEPTDNEDKGRCRRECAPGEIEYVDGDVAKAMAHPLRVQILAALNKWVMSPSGFSRRFEEKLQNVSYHFRVLLRYGLIEEVGTRQVRGSTEHFYRATKRVLFDGKAWEDLPPSLKAEVSARAVGDFLEAVTAAMLGETFDSSDERVAVWLQRRLDEQGWEDAVAAHWELIHKMEGIFKGSATRLAKAGEPDGGIVATYGLFLFESPPLEPERPEEEDE